MSSTTLADASLDEGKKASKVPWRGSCVCAGSLPYFDRSNMNKRQVKGTAKEVAGKVQQGAGKVTGSKKQQAKGLAKQVEGKVQRRVGDAEEVIKDSNKRR